MQGDVPVIREQVCSVCGKEVNGARYRIGHFFMHYLCKLKAQIK